MERLKNKFSKLGHDSKTTEQGESAKERGKLDKDLAKSCYQKQRFQDLTEERERDAFFRFLRGDHYPEKEDICHVDNQRLRGFARKYQFWLKCQNIELVKLFEDYITTDDDDKRLPEVESMPNVEDVEDHLEKKKESAKELDEFMTQLKYAMKHDLDAQFTEFRKQIKKCYSKDL